MRLRCPRCSTIVEAPPGREPVCPGCGYVATPPPEAPMPALGAYGQYDAGSGTGYPPAAPDPAYAGYAYPVAATRHPTATATAVFCFIDGGLGILGGLSGGLSAWLFGLGGSFGRSGFTGWSYLSSGLALASAAASVFLLVAGAGILRGRAPSRRMAVLAAVAKVAFAVATALVSILVWQMLADGSDAYGFGRTLGAISIIGAVVSGVVACAGPVTVWALASARGTKEWCRLP